MIKWLVGTFTAKKSLGLWWLNSSINAQMVHKKELQLIALRDGRTNWKKNIESSKTVFWDVFDKITIFRGDWSQEEDIQIISFVLKNGTKWSKLAEISLEKRTEHNLKNRFFSILGRELKFQTKKVKKYVDYRNEIVLLSILNNIQKWTEMKIK